MGVRVQGGSRRERDKELLARVEQEGQEAYGAGVPLAGNPYPDGGGMAWSGRHARWVHGWRRAEWAVQRADYEAGRAQRAIAERAL